MPEQAWYAVAVCIEKDGNGWSVEYGTILDVVQASSLDEAKGKVVAVVLRERKGWFVRGKCGFELVDFQPLVTLTSDPPQKAGQLSEM